MQFLTPFFWLAVAAVAVPIFLHLTRRAEKRSQPFASLMFFRRIPFQEFRRRRIRDLLLLLLRCALIALLAAAFSEPVLRSFSNGIPGIGNKSIVMLVDNSYSMSRATVRSRLDAGIREVIGEMDSGDEATLVLYTQTALVAAPWTPDGQRIEAAWDRANRAGFDSASLAAGLSRGLAQIAEAGNPTKRIVIFTDLQSTSLDLERAGIRIPAGVNLEVRDVGEDAGNYYLAPPDLARMVYAKNVLGSLPIRILHSPASARVSGQKGTVRIFEGATLLQQHSFSTAEDGVTTVLLDPLQLEEGIHRLQIELDIEDVLPEDNRRYLILERKDPFEVRLVTHHQDAAGSAFIEEALGSGSALPFKVTRFSEDPLEGLGTGSVLLAQAPGPLFPQDRVEDFVSNGGGLVLLPGTEASPFFSAAGTENRIRPGRFSNPVFAGGVKFFSVAETADEHPVFAPFRHSRDSRFGGAQFFAYWKLETAGAARVLARFGTGDPALLESSLGKGRVLLPAFPVDRNWTDFPLRAAFVPFWHQLVLYAAQWQPRPSALAIGDPLDRDLEPSREAAVRWEIRDPSGERLTRLGEEVPVNLSAAKPGYYEIRRGGASDWIAANIQAAESDLTRTTIERLDQVLGSLRPAEDTLPSGEVVGEAEAPNVPLWWSLLLAAGALLLVEGLVANRSGIRTRIEPRQR